MSNIKIYNYLLILQGLTYIRIYTDETVELQGGITAEMLQIIGLLLIIGSFIVPINNSANSRSNNNTIYNKKFRNLYGNNG